MIQNIKFRTIHYLLVYSISLISFVSFILINKRSYHDIWILSDIVAPTLIFIIIFLVVVIYCENDNAIVLICSSFIMVLTLIPALKYEIFYGAADTTFHYMSISKIISDGHVISETIYSGTPSLHIFISIFTQMSGISQNIGFKYAMPVTFGVVPLLFYFISHKLVVEKTLVKYVVIASAFPLITAYYLVGTIFPLIFLIILVPLPIIRENQEKKHKSMYGIILIIVLFALLVSHTITSLFFLLFLVWSIPFLMLTNMIKRFPVSQLLLLNLSKVLLLATVLFISWWMYQANFLFGTFVENIVNVIVEQSINKAPVPQRFFEIPLLSKVKIFSIFHLKDAIISLLTIFGLITIPMLKTTNVEKSFYIYLISFLTPILAFIVFQLVTGYGDFEYYRFINYGLIFTPFFVGVLLYRVKLAIDSSHLNFKMKPMLMLLIMFAIISISLIQFFPYQPLVPNANEMSEIYTYDDDIFEFNHVNTIYQKNMIYFTSKYTPTYATITSDIYTRLQLIAFYDELIGTPLTSRHTWHSAIMNEELEWDYFLLHWNGKSGPFTEQFEYRTNEKIMWHRNIRGRNIIYDNEESFIIQRNILY